MTFLELSEIDFYAGGCRNGCHPSEVQRYPVHDHLSETGYVLRHQLTYYKKNGGIKPQVNATIVILQPV